MRPCVFLLVSAVALSSARAFADGRAPACPSIPTDYSATVNGNTVTVCPTVNTDSSGGCPYLTGMIRVDIATGDVVSLPLEACAPPPMSGDAGPGVTSCFQDDCVPPGTYLYGYALPGDCSDCVGPRTGELAVVATVTAPLSNCPSIEDIPTTNPFDWDVSKIVDGAIPYSYTCVGDCTDCDPGAARSNDAAVPSGGGSGGGCSIGPARDARRGVSLSGLSLALAAGALVRRRRKRAGSAA